MNTPNVRVNSKLRKYLISLFLSSLAGFVGAGVYAQDSANEEDSDDTEVFTLESFVVTGTLIRGVAPTGTQLMNIDEREIRSTAATSGSQLLATMPQVGNFFNDVPKIPGGASSVQQVVRPNLRNLPGQGQATGSATLILIDGQRVAGVGVSTYAVDPDLVPMGALQNVEIVTDGGSSLYGADAIGGVINYVTRRRFDGVQTNVRYGAADNYYTKDLNFTFGKDWGDGSAYLSYNYAKNDSISNDDRDYSKRLDYTVDPPVPTGREGDIPNIQAGGFPQFGIPGTFYALPDLVPNTFNAYDLIEYTDMLPAKERQGLFGSYAQDVNDKLKVDLRAYYGEQETLAASGPVRATVDVPPTNPFYIALPAPNDTANQRVSFSFGPLLGNDTQSARIEFDEWGASAKATFDLDDNWQVRSLISYSGSETGFYQSAANTALLNAAGAGDTVQTAINPYDISNTPNLELIDEIVNWEIAGQGTAELLNFRVVADGAIFKAPGGDARIAVGVEYLKDTFEQRFGSQVIGGIETLAWNSYERDVNSAFAELALPLVGDENKGSAVHALDLSLAARYDDYSDFGSTFNPKLGVTYKPNSWLSLQGNVGTSFNAPTPVDQLGSLRNSLIIVPFPAAVRPGDVPAAGSYTIALDGASSDLMPQEADTWSVGFDMNVPGIEGLRFNASYYDIFFEGTLNKAPVFNAQQLYENFPDFVIVNPTAEQIAAYGEFAINAGGPDLVAPFLDGVPPVYQLIDFRISNLGNTKLSGLDFALSYKKDTKFGGVDASIAGNFQLGRETQLSSLAPFTDDLETGEATFRVQTAFGADINNLRAQVTWNHTDGFDVLRSISIPQDRVSGFDTVDLFFRYDFEGKDLSLTLNVNNILDEDPPVYRRSGGDGYDNGFSVGRLIMLGLSKKI